MRANNISTKYSRFTEIPFLFGTVLGTDRQIMNTFSLMWSNGFNASLIKPWEPGIMGEGEGTNLSYKRRPIQKVETFKYKEHSV